MNIQKAPVTSLTPNWATKSQSTKPEVEQAKFRQLPVPGNFYETLCSSDLGKVLSQEKWSPVGQLLGPFYIYCKCSFAFLLIHLVHRSLMNVSACLCVFYSMFRSPQLLSWTYPMRQLLLFRESHLSAFSEHIGFGRLRARCVKERTYEGTCGKSTIKGGLLLSTRTSAHELREILPENLLSKDTVGYHQHHPQVSAKTQRASCLVSTFWNCLFNRTFHQRWRRPWDLSQTSLGCINNNQRNFLHHVPNSFRSFSSSAQRPWILKPRCCKRSPGHAFRLIQTVRQTVPHVVDTWRGSLSLQNEARCRQELAPNWKLYDMDKLIKGASQTQGANQGRWAAILVSLCSVEGEPAFLFTLRSSTLRGKHKGDVRLVGG